jgi:hypothetical protein
LSPGGNRPKNRAGSKPKSPKQEQWVTRYETIHRARGGVTARLVGVESAEVLWLGHTS